MTRESSFWLAGASAGIVAFNGGMARRRGRWAENGEDRWRRKKASDSRRNGRGEWRGDGGDNNYSGGGRAGRDAAKQENLAA